MEMTGGIEVRITGATSLEVLARLTAWGLRASSDPRVYALASQIMELEEKLKAYPKEGAAPDPAPAQTAPAPQPQPDPVPTEAPGPAGGETGPTAAPTEVPSTDGAPVPTPEEVTAKGREAAKKYGSAAIKPILKKFGVERMSELAEKDRAAFLARLEGLGGKDA